MFAKEAHGVLGHQSMHVCTSGEVVPFSTPVKISETPSINAWLTKVEQQMQLTLAKLLEQAMTEFEAIAAAAVVRLLRMHG